MRPLAAEVEVDRIPELLGEIERLPAVLWAQLTMRNGWTDCTEDWPVERKGRVILQA